MNGPGAAQPGGSLTGTLAQFFRTSGSLATGMVALEDRNIHDTFVPSDIKEWNLSIIIYQQQFIGTKKLPNLLTTLVPLLVV